MRTWLNGEFLNKAFSEEEQEKILTTTVSADKNPEYGTNPGSVVKDRVFLLSVTEAQKLFAGNAARDWSPTAYASQQVGDLPVPGRNCWLRTPGMDSSMVATVNTGGEIFCQGDSCFGGQNNFVRPVIWIETKPQ